MEGDADLDAEETPSNFSAVAMVDRGIVDVIIVKKITRKIACQGRVKMDEQEATLSARCPVVCLVASDYTRLTQCSPLCSTP